MADEAAAFVSLNQQRRPLTQLDLFKAALAGVEKNYSAAVIESGFLSLNSSSWAPGGATLLKVGFGM